MPPSDSPRRALPPGRWVRPACLVLPALLALTLASAHADPRPGHNRSVAAAADAAAPTLPLLHAPLAPQPPLPDAPANPENWQKAHDAVGAFPRGHADILAWESAQLAQPAPATTQPDAGAHSVRGAHGGAGSTPTSQHPMHQHGRHHPVPGSRP